ncbi:MAG: hypothetical protein AB1435_03405 [Chloroflexota bacterium]
MVSLLRRSVGWLMRAGGHAAFSALMRHGGRSVVESAVGAAVEAVPKGGQRSFTQVFSVSRPVTVYVRGSHCAVSVRQHDAPRVELEANLARSFGVELTAEQDEAGIYIVARRKPVVGTVARMELTLAVPPDTHLAFHLTPGEVSFLNLNGLAQFPAAQVFAPADDPSPDAD